MDFQTVRSEAEQAIKNGEFAKARSLIGQLKRLPNGDSLTANLLTAELAREESAQQATLKTRLLNAQQKPVNNHRVDRDPYRGRGDIEEQRTDIDHELLLQGNKGIDETNQLIHDTDRQLQQSTNTGANTLVAMNAQGEIIMDIHTDVRDTGRYAKSANSVLKQMAKRALYNRILLWCVIIILFITDALFLYYGFIKK